MKKLLKGLAIFFVLFIIVISAGLFYANKKLNPEKIREIVVSHIATALPGANVALGKIDYSLGLTIVVHFSELNLSLKEKKTQLLNVKEAKAHIPLMPFVFGSSKIDLTIDSPIFNYLKMGNKNNWSIALGDAPEQKERKETAPNEVTMSEEEQMILELGPLATFLIDVGIYNAHVIYSDGIKRTEILVDKVKINDLGLSRSASFEIVTALSQKEHFSLRAKIIGELDVSHYLKQGDVNIVVNNQFNEIQIDDLGKLPDFSSEAKIKIHKGGKLELNGKGNFGEEGHFSANAIVEKRNLILSDIKASLNVAIFLSELGLQNKMAGLEFGKSTFNFEGSLLINDEEISPNITGSLGPSVSFSKSSLKTKNSASFSLKENQLEAMIKTTAYDGVVNTTIKTPLNLKAINLKDMKPLDVKVLVQGIKFNEKIKISSSASEKEDAAKGLLIPPMLLSVNFKDCIIDKSSLNGDIEMAILAQSAKLSKLKLLLSDGVVSGTSFVHYEDKIKGEFDFKIEKLDISKIENIISQDSFKHSTGIVDINSKGTFQMEDALTYKVFMNFSGEKIGAENINLGKYISDYINQNTNVSGFMKKDLKYEVGPTLDSLKFKSEFNQSHVLLKSVTAVLEKNVGQVKGNGKIFFKKGRSYLKLDYKDSSGNISKILRRDFNTSILPMLFEGEALLLKPNYEYSVKKLGKKALKQQGKKVIQKEINKALKGKTKEAAKKLLEEIFQ